MGGASLPPGFRFHPTDEELIGYYLKRKVEGLEIELEVIPVIEFYKFDPWELPGRSSSISHIDQLHGCITSVVCYFRKEKNSFIMLECELKLYKL
jgi:hypothetical protein